MTKLEVKDLIIEAGGKEIVKGISLDLCSGEVVAIMGPNGSGKSTLANTLMGHPKYKVVSGSIHLGGHDITVAPPTERAKKGLFLSFQYPVEIPGVTFSNFLRTAYNSIHTPHLSAMDFHKLLQSKLADLKMPPELALRHLNDGFSGGEKKKMEILQMSVLSPTIAVLDETDSGLDVDALRIVADGINKVSGKCGVLLITHYQRILDYVKPGKVHVMVGGKIVASGGSELAKKIEKEGYDWVENDIQIKNN